MQTFGSDLVQFIVLILPGFLGLFVYRPFVHQGIVGDSTNEMNISKAMLFGLPGYLVATHFSEIITTLAPRMGNLATLVRYSQNVAIQVPIAVVVSILFGITWGWIRRRWGPVEYFFASWHSNKNKISCDTPNLKGLEFMYREYYDKERLKGGPECAQVAFVYNISNPENVISGEILSYGIEINDITLNDSPSITKEQITQDYSKIRHWQKIINLDNGFVVEVVSIEKSVIDKIYNV